MDDPDRAKRNRLVRAQDDARGTIHRGVMLIALIPVTLLAAILAAFVIGPLGAAMGFIVAAAYALVGSIGGIATIAAGMTDHRKATKALRALDAPRQLPMARLVQR